MPQKIGEQVVIEAFYIIASIVREFKIRLELSIIYNHKEKL